MPVSRPPVTARNATVRTVMAVSQHAGPTYRVSLHQHACHVVWGACCTHGLTCTCTARTRARLLSCMCTHARCSHHRPLACARMLCRPAHTPHQCTCMLGHLVHPHSQPVSIHARPSASQSLAVRSRHASTGHLSHATRHDCTIVSSMCDYMVHTRMPAPVSCPGPCSCTHPCLQCSCAACTCPPCTQIPHPGSPACFPCM